jgi:hypothetical protein
MNVHEVVGSPLTVSDKIRRLSEAGIERAEIARLLGKRYQHVRNVLEADRLKRPSRKEPRPSEARPLPGGAFRLEVGSRGDLLVSAALLEGLGLSSGDAVIVQTGGDQLTLMSGATSLRRARDLIKSVVPDGVRLSDSLIEDRRREVETDTND